MYQNNSLKKPIFLKNLKTYVILHTKSNEIDLTENSDLTVKQTRTCRNIQKVTGKSILRTKSTKKTTPHCECTYTLY